MASSVIFHGRPTSNSLPSYRGPFGHWEWRQRRIAVPELVGYRREVQIEHDVYGNIIRTIVDVPEYVDRWELITEKVWVED